jgi:hypothetical protein
MFSFLLLIVKKVFIGFTLWYLAHTCTDCNWADAVT